MAEFSSDDSEYAANLVSRLINREGEGLKLEGDLVLSDVESDANKFTEELSLLEDLDANVPALRVDDERVPMSLSLALGGTPDGGFLPIGFTVGGRLQRHHPFFFEFFHDYLRPLLRGEHRIAGFELMDRSEARMAFVRHATDFVATRIAGVRAFRRSEGNRTSYRSSMLNLRQILRGPQVSTPGCTFTVSANSAGLRVFWSGAYYVTPNRFNHPTSPTTSVLQSGTYIFGVDGGAYGSNIQWDLNAVVSLPGLPYVHLNY